MCWREGNANLNLTTIDGETGKFKKPLVKMNTIKHPDTNKEPYVRVFIEITWPIVKPYKKGSGSTATYPRQSRLFVREYMDPTYYKPVN